MNWMPIETAPKDKTKVFLYMKAINHMLVGFYADTVTLPDTVVHRYWDTNDDPVRWIPTHWMPLPEPPEPLDKD